MVIVVIIVVIIVINNEQQRYTAEANVKINVTSNDNLNIRIYPTRLIHCGYNADITNNTAMHITPTTTLSTINYSPQSHHHHHHHHRCHYYYRKAVRIMSRSNNIL